MNSRTDKNPPPTRSVERRSDESVPHTRLRVLAPGASMRAAISAARSVTWQAVRRAEARAVGGYAFQHASTAPSSSSLSGSGSAARQTR